MSTPATHAPDSTHASPDAHARSTSLGEPTPAPVPAPAPVPLEAPRPLASLAPGSQCTVVRIEGNGGIDRRLLDLGFVPNTPVRVVRRAPLGDPVCYALRGFEICLRRSESERIWVRVRTP